VLSKTSRDAPVFRRLLGYATYMFMTGALTSLLSFGVDAMGMVTRPKESYGDYHIYVLILNIGVGLFISGPNGAIQKFGAGSVKQQRILVTLVLRTFVGLLVLTIGLGLASGFLWRWNIACALFGVPWLVIFWMSRYIVRSRLDAKYEAWLLVVGSLSKTLFIGGFLAFSDHPDAMIYGDILALILAGGVALYILNKTFEDSLLTMMKAAVPREFLREFFVFVRPLWLGGQVFLASQEFVGLFTTNIPWLGRTAMASMGVLRSFWQITFKPMDFISQAALPGLILEKEGREELYRDLLRLSLLLFSGLGLITAGLGGFLLDLFDIRQKYVEVPALMMIQAASVPIYVLHMALSQYTIAENFPRYTLFANITSLASNAALIYPLTLWFGLNGLVVCSSIGFLCSTSSFLYCLRKSHTPEVRMSIQLSLRTFMAVILSLAPIYMYRWADQNWRMVFPAFGAFAALSFLFQLWTWSDILRAVRLVKSMIKDRESRSESSTP
jgi:O-antigen/teichoic acid export membrane protein